MFSLVSARTRRSFSAELLSSWVVLKMYSCLGLFFPRCRTSHFSSLNFTRFLLANFSSLSNSFWTAAQLRGISILPPSLMSSANLLCLHNTPSSWPLTEMLNRTKPSINLWGILLVTGYFWFPIPFLFITLTVLSHCNSSTRILPQEYYRNIVCNQSKFKDSLGVLCAPTVQNKTALLLVSA